MQPIDAPLQRLPKPLDLCGDNATPTTLAATPTISFCSLALLVTSEEIETYSPNDSEKYRIEIHSQKNIKQQKANLQYAF
jgi:hypothetical protein